MDRDDQIMFYLGQKLIQHIIAGSILDEFAYANPEKPLLGENLQYYKKNRIMSWYKKLVEVGDNCSDSELYPELYAAYIERYNTQSQTPQTQTKKKKRYRCNKL